MPNAIDQIPTSKTLDVFGYTLATALPSLAGMRKFIRVAAIFALAWALCFLIWQVTQPVTFARIVPPSFAMGLIMDAGVILSSVSLLLYTYGNPSRKRQTAAHIGGGVIVLWGLAWWAVHQRWLSSEEVLGNDVSAQNVNGFFPITGIVLICLGLAILTLSFRTTSGQRPSQYLAGTLVLIGTAVVIGYFYSYSLFFTSRLYGPIDASSAILCILLGLALLCVHPTEGFMRSLTSPEIGGPFLRRLVPVIIALPIFAGWLGILGQRQNWHTIDFGVALGMGGVTLVLLAWVWYLGGWAAQIDRAHFGLVRAWAEQETKLRLAASAARIGYWRWVGSKNVMEMDQVTGELLGLPSDSPITLGAFVQAIAQEDRREFMQTMETAYRAGKSFWLECRPARATHAHWISMRGFPPDHPETSAYRLQGVIVDITERRLAQRALQESQQRLNSIVQSAMDAIITVDQDQKILLFNKAAEELFKCPSGEALGKPINQFIPERFRQRHHSHIMGFQQSMVNARAMGLPGSVKALRTDGQEFPIEASISQVSVDGQTLCTVILRDITERLQSEDAIRERETRFRNMADSAPVMIFITSSAGVCTYLNRQWYQFTGQTEETGLGTGWLNRVHKDDRLQLSELLHDRDSTGLRRLECRVQGLDGEFRWALCSLSSMIGDGGRWEGCIGSISDITDRRLAEETLKRSSEELERQVAERTAALRHSREQLRALTHQLTRTEHQERRRIAGELHDYLAQLLVAAHLKLAQDTRPLKTKQDHALTKDLERILDEALTYTRSLVAKLSPPVLYHLGLPQALQWLAEQMLQEHELLVETTFDLPSSFPRLPDDMATILFQSVRELLFNVIKHAGPSQAQIALRTMPDQQLVIVVTDQGRGFESKKLDQSSTVPTSFGLFSIKERMEALGGSMYINSRTGQGTSVTLLCPLTIPKTGYSLSPRSEGNATVSTSAALQPERALRVLLVDDHAMVREGIRALLERQPAVEVVGEAWDGQHACELVATLPLDVIVMDANMPRLDGIEATRRIKQMHPQIVIIGLSVQTANQVATSMLQAGASAYVTKESAGEQLYETILKSIGHRRRETQETRSPWP